MSRRQLGAIMLALSIVYGGLIGLLAVLGSGAVSAVAIIGGTIVGLGWALSGFLPTRSRE